MKRITMTLCVLGALTACGEEPPPPSVIEFMEDPILLEATMVRCGENRAATRYEGECVNARSAIDQLAAAAEETKRKALEAKSERKRQALRRAQAAAAAARQRVAEEAKRREEAVYFGQFEPLLPAGEQPQATGPAASIDGNAGQAGTGIPGTGAGPAPEALTLPDAGAAADSSAVAGPGETSSEPPAPAAATGDAAATVSTEGADLDSVREELKRRQDEPE
ncbi:MAG: EexN family lipoprotein, partial [Woeseiaceae bacterium]